MRKLFVTPAEATDIVRYGVVALFAGAESSPVGAAAGTPETNPSCNYVVNFFHAGPWGKSAGGYTGPITFGEVGYILVDQTLVRLPLEYGAGRAP